MFSEELNRKEKIMTESKQEKQTVEGIFVLAYTCKHSVRYNAIDDKTKKIMTSVYVSNDTCARLSAPDKIKITITNI